MHVPSYSPLTKKPLAPDASGFFLVANYRLIFKKTLSIPSDTCRLMINQRLLRCWGEPEYVRQPDFVTLEVFRSAEDVLNGFCSM